MYIANYLPAVLSTLFRFSVYVFLRVIPTSLARFVLPFLYVAHFLSSWLLAPPPLAAVSSEEKSHANIHGTPPREHQLRTLVFSLPSRSKGLRRSIIILNTLLLIPVIDFIVTPYMDTASDVIFTRVGAVYPDSVKISARYRDANARNANLSLHIVYRETRGTNATAPAWTEGPLLTFRPENDWVDTARLTGLWPNTSYEYAFFAVNNTVFAYPPSPIRFRTFPDPLLPGGNHFKFIVTSCMISNHPYNGPFYRRAIRGFDLLASYLYPALSYTSTEFEVHSNITPANNSTSQFWFSTPVEFLLFLGDFIYADVPLYIGDHQESYRRLYRRNYQSSSFRKIYERLPIFHAYDDHEFKNNFGASGNDSMPPYLSAASAYKTYNADANYEPLGTGEYYYDFQFGDSTFFVMDTRRHRKDLGTANRTMLGPDQLVALKSWLSRVNGTSIFKFVVTSVPFTSLWGHDAQSDSWAGFPEEKRRLLEMFHSVPNLILLSGDRHEFAVVEFNGARPEDHPLLEISTSPLSMFYIPIVRTLVPHSGVFVQKNRTIHSIGGKAEANILIEDIPTERVIKYIPNGNYKWSTIEVNTRDIHKPTLSLEVIIHGKPTFRHEVIGTPVKVHHASSLGVFVPNKIQDILDKLGLHPSKWF